MGSPGNKKISFEISENSAVYEFVKAFAKSAVTKLEKLDGKSEMSKYHEIGASGPGSLLAIAFPIVAPFQQLIRSLNKAGLEHFDKIEQEKKELAIKSATASTSSAAFPRDFLRLYIGLGLCVYHSYRAYFEYINLEIKSTDHDNKLLAIQMLGEYAGAKCFSHMHNHASQNEEDFLTAVSKKSIKRWRSSTWDSLVLVDFYFWVQKETGGANEKTKITPYDFFSGEVFTPPKYAWNFDSSVQTGKKKYTLFKTKSAGGSVSLDFSYGFQEADLNGLAEFICNKISHDSTFSWKDAILVKVEGTYVLVDSVDRKVSKLIDIAAEQTDMLEEIGENQREQNASFEDMYGEFKQFCLQEKPVDPQPKIVRFRVDEPSPNFTGRTKFLEDLEKMVKKGQGGGDGPVKGPTQKTPITVVAGTGGIGKTSTVRKYVQEHDLEYEHIVWIDAEKFSSAKEQFKKLAMRLQIPTDFDKKEKPLDQILTEIFERLVGNVLLVLDNAEAFDDDSDRKLSGIRRLLPPVSPSYTEPTIIVTSRNLDWSVDGEVSESVITIPLGLWSDDEVASYVARQLPLQNDEEALQQLGTRFGHLPIAVKSAVAVIRQQNKRDGNNKYGILDLLEEYHKSDSETRKTVLEQEHLKASVGPEETDNKITMLVLWNISLEKIVDIKDGKLAIKILCFMAYMSPTRIPRNFLFALFKNSRTENALEILKDYTLIASLSSDDDDDSNSRSFSIHRMIQDSTIENLRARTNEGQTLHNIFKEATFLDEMEVLRKLSGRAVTYLMTLMTSTSCIFSRHGELVESLVEITNHVSEKLDVEICRDLTWCTAEVLKRSNNFPKSIELFERALQATPSTRVRDEILKKVTVQHMLAAAYGQAGHVQKSFDLHSEVLHARTLALGPDHEDTLDAKKRIAAALFGLRRYDEATEMYHEVLQVYEKNGDIQSAIYVKNSKAICASRSIDKTGSKVDLEVSAEDLNYLKELKQDPDCTDSMTTNLMLATILTREGDLEEASTLLLKISKVATKRFGRFNLRTLECRLVYGSGLATQKKYDQAATVLKKILKRGENQLGSDHRTILDTKLFLGAVYSKTKQLDKAVDLVDLQVWERVYGQEDPETMKAANILFNVKEEQGKFGEALELHQKVLQIKKNVFGLNHEDTLSTMQHIINLHCKMDEYEKAHKAAQELLERVVEAKGKNHPIAINTVEFLAQCKERLAKQNYLIRRFSAFTSADVETGKSFLKALDWNFEAALDSFRNSNPNAHIADEDPASTPGTSGTSTAAQMKNSLISEFMAVTGVDAEVGELFLHPCGWNLQVAIDAFYDSRIYKDIGALNLQDQAMIPEYFSPTQSAAATDAENQNLAAASCNKTVINQLQNLGVQVESVAEPNQPTTSILFGPTAYSADPDEASTSGSGTSTEAQIQNPLILNFMEMMEVNAEIGKSFLQASDWNLEDALRTFIESITPDEDTADLNLQGQALIPLEVGTDAENPNVAAASCNKRVANEIQDRADPGVQVESVPKPKRTTTSISFSCPGGARLRGEFGVSSTVKDLYEFVNEKRPDLADSNYVLTLHPNTKLTEMEETMEEANLLNNAALTLKMQKK